MYRCLFAFLTLISIAATGCGGGSSGGGAGPLPPVIFGAEVLVTQDAMNGDVNVLVNNTSTAQTGFSTPIISEVSYTVTFTPTGGSDMSISVNNRTTQFSLDYLTDNLDALNGGHLTVNARITFDTGDILERGQIITINRVPLFSLVTQVRNAPTNGELQIALRLNPRAANLGTDVYTGVIQDANANFGTFETRGNLSTTVFLVGAPYNPVMGRRRQVKISGPFLGSQGTELTFEVNDESQTGEVERVVFAQ